MLHVLTWNVNSVRLRLPLLLTMLERTQADVACLQETKTEDAAFPAEALSAAGYVHQRIRGEKSYNGVAIISKRPVAESFSLPLAGEKDARHIAVRLADGLLIHNLYVPAGGDVPDPEENPKYAHKLRTLEAMCAARRKDDRDDAGTILVGDLNVAPEEDDVWSHKQLLNVVSHTPPETDRMRAAIAAGDWTDLRRRFVPDGQKHYTWWSYRNQDWRKSAKGRRLDHIWCSPAAVRRAQAYMTHPWTRDAASPSDHIPVSAIFAERPRP